MGFTELDNGTTTGVIPKEHKDYRCWVYSKQDGEVLSKIVTAEQAQELYKDGWVMTPAEFTDNKELKDNMEFEAMADDMAQRLNFLLNIKECDDSMALHEFAKEFLQLKLHHKLGNRKVKDAIIKKATELGMIE